MTYLILSLLGLIAAALGWAKQRGDTIKTMQAQLEQQKQAAVTGDQYEKANTDYMDAIRRHDDLARQLGIGPYRPTS